MTDKKPSPVQLQALRYAEAGDLYRSERIHNMYKPITETGHRVREQTVESCWQRGWLRLGEYAAGYALRRPYLLTDDGKAALARWGGAL